MIPTDTKTIQFLRLLANSTPEAFHLQTSATRPTDDKLHQMLVYLHSAETVLFANLKKNIQKLISMLASTVVSLPASQAV